MTHPFSQTLLDWYATHGRELPWRETTDPYRIWISEIILQQTRVAQGYDYYLRFVERFPTVEVLAAATEDEVLHRWEGLGYYSRARNLHAAAQQIVAQGGFPRDYAGVRALKGVGDYTAAAICSFAYGLPTAVVDGNVYRVLARYFAIDTPIDVAAGKKEFAQLADSLMVSERAADYNQAIMDFGAVQCTPRAPRCLICPLVETCAARQTGQVEDYPVKSKKVAVTHRYFTYILLVDTSAEEPALLIRRRPSGRYLAGVVRTAAHRNARTDNGRRGGGTSGLEGLWAGRSAVRDVGARSQTRTHAPALACRCLCGARRCAAVGRLVAGAALCIGGLCFPKSGEPPMRTRLHSVVGMKARGFFLK